MEKLVIKNEKWVDILDYEGYYRISNFGRILNSDGKLLIFSNKKGYLAVHLRKDENIKQCYVHRLVLQSFTGNIGVGMQTNHKNGLKHDNALENLEWCNQSHNIRHAIDNGLMPILFKTRPVFQLDSDLNVVCHYRGMKAASRMTGIDRSCIYAACNGIQKSAGGFIWKYELVEQSKKDKQLVLF